MGKSRTIRKFLEKSNELKISSEILDLTTFDIPLFNPRIHSKENLPDEIKELKAFRNRKVALLPRT